MSHDAASAARETSRPNSAALRRNLVGTWTTDRGLCGGGITIRYSADGSGGAGQQSNFSEIIWSISGRVLTERWTMSVEEIEDLRSENRIAKISSTLHDPEAYQISFSAGNSVLTKRSVSTGRIYSFYRCR